MKLFLTVTVILGLLVTPVTVLAFAFSNPFGSPFGGRVTAIIPCTCSGIPPLVPIKIVVGPPRGGSFIFMPGISTLYRFYKLLPPSWVLGTSVGRRECLVGIPPACVPAGAGGTIIRMTGTSLF